MLETSLKKGAKAAVIALPKGGTAAVYRPATITFPTLSRREKSLPDGEAPAESVREADINTSALSEALLLESLRHSRYLEM